MVSKFVNMFLFLLLVGFACSTAKADDNQVELASTVTSYGDYGKIKGRAHNIRTAAKTISKRTIQPGESFSFNKTVGVRNKNTGYKEAPVISGGKLQDGFGGGICQLASTIHASAMKSGLKFIERYPHTRVVSYVSPGMDATVDWGKKDLIFKNPYKFPITLKVSTFPGNKPHEEMVKAVITAPKRKYDIKIKIQTTTIKEYDIVEIRDSSLKPGEKKVVQAGTPKVYAVVKRFFCNGKTCFRKEKHENMYKDSDRIVRVGPKIRIRL